MDKAETAKILLNNKCLQNRVTFLPLDKIDGRSAITKKHIDEAKKLIGAENVYVPSQLIDYEPELKPIVDYVFGNSLVLF